MAAIGYIVGFNKGVDIAKSDTVDIVGPKALTDSVYVGGAGTVIAVWQDSSTSTFTAVAGEILPISVRRIGNSSGASLMVALYAV